LFEKNKSWGKINMSKKVKLVIDELQKLLGSGRVKENEILKDHTSIKIGGKCTALIEPKNIEELQSILTLFYKYKVRFFVIGNGTNLLISDKGIRAFIIKLSKNFSNIKKDGDNLCVLAGTSLLQLNNYCIKEGLSGLEFSYGIPGSVGGATYMNAGAYGGQMSNVVTGVTYIDKVNIKHLSKEELQFDYRKSVFQNNPNYIILKVEFKLENKNKEEVKKLSNEILNKRKENHPTDFSAGSVFKRHKYLIASKTIDELNLKGTYVGGAKISEKHAGFIVNTGNATRKDVLKLVKIIQKKVYKKHKTTFELEVKLLGE